MSDEIIETAKATQEVAKTASKAIEATQKLGSFVAKTIAEPLEATIGILTDKLRFMRWERQIRLVDKCNELIIESGIEGKTRLVPPKIALPIIQNASLEEDDSLQDLWAHLLVTAPDFLIDIEGQIIGVEITDVYRDLGFGNSAKTQKDFPIIYEEVINNYNKINGVPLLFFFGFDGNMPTNNRKKSIQKLSEFVNSYITLHLPEGLNENEIIDIKIPDSAKIDLPFLYSIRVRPTEHPKGIGSFYTFFNSTPPPNIIFERAIRKKEVRIPEYKKRCEKIWLLITLPFLTLSTDYILQLNENINISHEFDASWVLDSYRERIQIVNKVIGSDTF